MFILFLMIICFGGGCYYGVKNPAQVNGWIEKISTFIKSFSK